MVKVLAGSFVVLMGWVALSTLQSCDGGYYEENPNDSLYVDTTGGQGGSNTSNCLQSEAEIFFTGEFVDAQDDPLSGLNVQLYLGNSVQPFGQAFTNTDGEFEVNVSTATLQQAGASGANSDRYYAVAFQGQQQLASSNGLSYSRDCDVEYPTIKVGGANNTCLDSESSIDFSLDGLNLDATDLEDEDGFQVIISFSGNALASGVTNDVGEFYAQLTPQKLKSLGCNGVNDVFTISVTGKGASGMATKTYDSGCEVVWGSVIMQ